MTPVSCTANGKPNEQVKQTDKGPFFNSTKNLNVQGCILEFVNNGLLDFSYQVM